MSETDQQAPQPLPPPTDTTRDPVLAGQTGQGRLFAPVQWGLGKLAWIGRLTRRQARFLLIML
ncbi:MAG: ABC transporter permease, partial [Acetobacter sp.]|nr:ABC transporter permease [Acetobacter sp.]